MVISIIFVFESTYTYTYTDLVIFIREQKLIMAQIRAEEILIECENFTDLVVGVCNNMSTFCWGMKKVMEMKLL